MQSSKDAAFALSVQILGVDGPFARDYDRTVMLALERLRLSGLTISAAGVLSIPSQTLALDSPALTGIPTAPTAAPGTNTTQLATTAFVTAAGIAAATPVVATTTLTGSQSAFVLPAGCGLLKCNNASLLTIVGFATGSFVSGQTLVIESIGAGQVNLTHAGGIEAQMFNIATSAPTPLSAGSGRATYKYDGTFLQLLHYEQGAWITPTFAAGNFTAGAMTWTVEAGDVNTGAYLLRGRTILVAFRLLTTTLAGTPSNGLLISNGAWGGFTAAGNTLGPWGSLNDGASEIGNFFASGTGINLNKLTTGNFTVSGTNNVYIQGTAEFPVT